MSRRGGKAASRRARQKRRAQHPKGSSPATFPPSPSAPAPIVAPEAPVRVPARAVSVVAGGGSSRLSERAREEYHYVGRDLRNIAVLMLAIGVMLTAVVIVAHLTGVIPA